MRMLVEIESSLDDDTVFNKFVQRLQSLLADQDKIEITRARPGHLLIGAAIDKQEAFILLDRMGWDGLHMGLEALMFQVDDWWRGQQPEERAKLLEGAFFTQEWDEHSVRQLLEHKETVASISDHWRNTIIDMERWLQTLQEARTAPAADRLLSEACCDGSGFIGFARCPLCNPITEESHGRPDQAARNEEQTNWQVPDRLASDHTEDHGPSQGGGD